jgi:2,4-dienoyl-CoA reductase-like NADH-dependent reductase (Old Yellow Enzyme family)
MPMEPTNRLFEPITLGGVTLANRIAVSPTCQYSAEKGSANGWHLWHLRSLSLSGTGLLVVEQTAVEPTGRISHGCLGLYSDANEAALTVALCRHSGLDPARHPACPCRAQGVGENPGRVPPAGDTGAWETAGPSAIPYDERWPVPRSLDEADLARIRDAHAQYTQRADRLGFDLVELLGAHGFCCTASCRRSQTGTATATAAALTRIVDRIAAVCPDARVITRDLAADPPPHPERDLYEAILSPARRCCSRF